MDVDRLARWRRQRVAVVRGCRRRMFRRRSTRARTISSWSHRVSTMSRLVRPRWTAPVSWIRAEPTRCCAIISAARRPSRPVRDIAAQDGYERGRVGPTAVPGAGTRFAISLAAGTGARCAALFAGALADGRAGAASRRRRTVGRAAAAAQPPRKLARRANSPVRPTPSLHRHCGATVVV